MNNIHYAKRRIGQCSHLSRSRHTSGHFDKLSDHNGTEKMIRWENLEGTVSQRINTKHIRHHAFLKVTPILRTYVLATHRLLYHAQAKNAYTILDYTGAKDSEINQTILKAVEYYRTVQGSLVNVIRRTGQESPALHGFPSLKFNIVMRRVSQYRLAFNQSVGHTTLQICKIIYLVMIKKYP